MIYPSFVFCFQWASLVFFIYEVFRTCSPGILEVFFSLDTVCFLVFASDHLQSNIAFLFIKPLQNDLWIIRAQKKALNSKDEPVLFLHITGNLAKNQF